MWFDKLGCVEPLKLVSSIHVPGNSILFEPIPVEGKLCEDTFCFLKRQNNQISECPNEGQQWIGSVKIHTHWFSCSLPQIFNEPMASQQLGALQHVECGRKVI